MKKEINKIISWIEMSYTRLNYKEELLLVNYIKQLQQENKGLKERINKAIEYIESKEMYNDDFDTEVYKLLKILKEVE